MNAIKKYFDRLCDCECDSHACRICAANARNASQYLASEWLPSAVGADGRLSEDAAGAAGDLYDQHFAGY